MRPYTEKVPKILLPVAGRPFADWQIDWLVAGGITRIVFSIGHLGEAVKAYVGRGERWGVAIDYVEEGPDLRGTAGAIRLAADSGILDEAFFLLYGDAYLSIDFAIVEAEFRAANLPVLMTVFRNNNEGERSNVIFRNGMVQLYDKFWETPIPDMTYIDYGLSVMRRDVILHRVPSGQQADLAPLLKELSTAGLVAGYEARHKYFEVGSPTGVRELER